MKAKFKLVVKQYFKLAAYILVSLSVFAISIGNDEKELLRAFDIFESTFSAKKLFVFIVVILVIIGLIASIKSMMSEIDIEKFSEKATIFFLEILANTFYSFVVGISSFLFFYLAFCMYMNIKIPVGYILSMTIIFYLTAGAEAIFFKSLVAKQKKKLENIKEL